MAKLLGNALAKAGFDVADTVWEFGKVPNTNRYELKIADLSKTGPKALLEKGKGTSERTTMTVYTFDGSTIHKEEDVAVSLKAKPKGSTVRDPNDKLYLTFR